MLEVKTKPIPQDVQMALDQLKTIGLNFFELKNGRELTENILGKEASKYLKGISLWEIWLGELAFK